MQSAISITICSLCLGTGFELTEHGARECICAREKRIAKNLEASRIPERFKTASFESFHATTTSLRTALMKTRTFVEETPGQAGLLFIGNCGLGKTHLACAALDAIIRKGLSGIFYEFRDLLTAIRNSYNSQTQSSELQILAPILRADCLVLDELGAAKPTDWVQETLTYIVNERYNSKRVTVFTSNYPDITGGHYDETLTDRVGVRLRSRLHEMCRLVPMEGEDYRVKIRNRI